MYKLKKPKNYISSLNLRDTQKAIKLLKDSFELELAYSLNLERVSAPMIVPSKSGINDDLSGVERPVRFDIAAIKDYDAEVVHSLAKWKRIALKQYGFKTGEGLYTDMNALRRDDEIDNIHSIYVDQWDWEIVIDKAKRTEEFLKSVVLNIANSIHKTLELLKIRFPSITTSFSKDVFFITAQELLNLYPNLTANQREEKITREKKTVFILKIGTKLSNGEYHSLRAPDYDDWSLNGDLIVWNDVLSEPLELSSMGVRVDEKSLKLQLQASSKTDRLKHSYHKAIIDNSLPLTIGGGIGQSRLCMFLLGKAHIGEVQASIWPKKLIEECKKENIILL